MSGKKTSSLHIIQENSSHELFNIYSNDREINVPPHPETSSGQAEGIKSEG
jgi:hypothetical protein